MKLLRSATLTVADLDAAIARYRDFLDYAVVHEGEMSADLAAFLRAPKSKGARYCVMQPASGVEIYLRLVEQPSVDGYTPLTSYGWAAIEVCVQDVLAAYERIKPSPFEVIGPPREIDGLPAIYPMQIKGPDGEIVYLTQIRDDLPAYDLPRATSPIDRLFILVVGCSDMHASLKWFDETLNFETGRVMEIEYHMLADAYGTPRNEMHTIATGIHGRDVFLELDQYPPAATARPKHAGMLDPGAALGSFLHPDFDQLKGWVSEPSSRAEAPYNGKRAGVLQGPDGLLVEVIEL
jgi:catechol 2,3-dioxygenase-like lactoylglutathione lyase family enzyme